MNWSALAAPALSWTARGLALVLLLFWGAFFVHHLEWFAHPSRGLPPPWVWLNMLLHLAVLAGLAALWRWRLAGAALTILAACAFFGGLAVREALAGHRYATLVLFLAITITPALLELLSWCVQHRQLAVSKPPEFHPEA